MANIRLQAIASRIASRAKLARGVVVVHESAAALAPALRKANLLVILIPPKAKHEEIKTILLHHRILITKNATAFVDDAPVYEYGIVSLKKLGFIDPEPTYAKNKTVKLISKALSKFGLFTKGAKFLLELRPDGRHELRALE